MLAPQITFGMIVLNGEPFVVYNLRAIYPFAHQIVVVEGACPSAQNVATVGGHSRDGTLEALYKFQKEEDPDHKLVIVTAENEGKIDGFWSEKDEMSQAYARRATGNYLWQVDSDEFYLAKDIQSVIGILSLEPEIKAVSFRMITFWGGLDYCADGMYLQRTCAHDIHRLFAWKPGYKYVTHRPPTVVDECGRDLRGIKSITASGMARKGIYMYHYELLLPKQVRDKCDYYIGAEWTDSLKDLNHWFETSYNTLKKPFRVHMVYNYLSWLERYTGEHTEQILKMCEAVKSNKWPGIGLRNNADVEKLLSNNVYCVKRTILKYLCTPIYILWQNTRQSLVDRLRGKSLDGPVRRLAKILRFPVIGLLLGYSRLTL